ncbi:MAG: PilZ domain-containing protein [Deltaproteobacteria bacterium]|nr:PilZ domain-containing protein [Deltaproteobacteria bacterium]MBZ0220134.1 PilZ domain-containing protein [Deltaproteobacteria bacterium]
MGNGKNQEDDYVVLRSDRRKNLRKQLLVLKVRGEDKAGVFFGYAKTVGRGGMFIASVNPKKAGEEFEISFKLGELDIKCRCVVAWSREYDSLVRQEPGMGIKFLDLDEASKNAIEEWLNRQ